MSNICNTYKKKKTKLQCTLVIIQQIRVAHRNYSIKFFSGTLMALKVCYYLVRSNDLYYSSPVTLFILLKYTKNERTRIGYLKVPASAHRPGSDAQRDTSHSFFSCTINHCVTAINSQNICCVFILTTKLEKKIFTVAKVDLGRQNHSKEKYKTYCYVCFPSGG